MALLRCLSRLLHSRATPVALCGVCALLLSPVGVSATPTGDYYKAGGEIYDDWDICRTRADGSDGFLQYVASGFEPIIVYESLGANADRAYARGVQFAAEYVHETQRAEAIFEYVRDRVRYVSDSSQFGQVEFAQNADELLMVVDEDGFAYGDCEDYAFLLGAMYVGAGIRAAVVLAPDHAATLVHLPDYPQANRVLRLNGESGWVWAEATGGNNPLGWMPENYMRVPLDAYELDDKGAPPASLPDKPTTTVKRSEGGGFSLPISPFFLVVFLLWLLSSLGRRRSASQW